MKNNYYALIMAGGVGSRFWPISTEKFPKQFHDMLGTGQSLIQQTFNRVNKLICSKNILISTNQRYKNLVLSQLPKCTQKQLLLEPVIRNTAPCILYAVLKIYNQNPNAVILVVPSDHWIDDQVEFIKNIKTCFEACQKHDILMTLGVLPNAPNIGYGYIEFEQNQSEIKKVKKFTEKPNLQTAKKFLESGNYLWNAGIFIGSAKQIICCFKKYLPKMFYLFNQQNTIYNTDFENDFIKSNYHKAENISIDFGIMEQAKNIAVLPVNFGWTDLGTWNSLYQKLKKDSDKNVAIGGQVIFKDANKNIIKTQQEKRVVIQGLSNFIVVEKQDLLLICSKDHEQEIKQIVTNVKDHFGDDFI